MGAVEVLTGSLLISIASASPPFLGIHSGELEVLVSLVCAVVVNASVDLMNVVFFSFFFAFMSRN